MNDQLVGSLSAHRENYPAETESYKPGEIIFQHSEAPPPPLISTGRHQQTWPGAAQMNSVRQICFYFYFHKQQLNLYKSVHFISSLLYLGQRRFILFIQQSRERRYWRKNTCGHKFPQHCWSLFFSSQDPVLHPSRPGERSGPPSAK